jgi:hypothetical protein
VAFLRTFAKYNLQFLVAVNKHCNQIHLTNVVIRPLLLQSPIYQLVIFQFILFIFMDRGGILRMLILQDY